MAASAKQPSPLDTPRSKTHTEQGAVAPSQSQSIMRIGAHSPVFEFWAERTLLEEHLLSRQLDELDLCILCLVGLNRSMGYDTHVSAITRMQKGYSRVTTMKRIRSLQKAGWIETTKSHQDRRVVLVTLTPQSLELLHVLSGELHKRRGMAYTSELGAVTPATTRP